LLDAGEVDTLCTRHLDFFMTLAEQAEPQLHGPDQVAWLDRLEAEHDNMRAALSWVLEQGISEAALRLSVALAWFWVVCGYIGEGRYWLQRVLEAGRAQQIQNASTVVRAYYGHALNWTSELAWRQGDYKAARALAEEGLKLLRELDDKQGIAVSLHRLGIIARDQGDHAMAHALFTESLTLWRELGDKRNIAGSLDSLGMIAHDQGDGATARTLYREPDAAARVGQQVGHCWLAQQFGGDSSHSRRLRDGARTLYREPDAAARVGQQVGYCYLAH
jgi:non-specific serine/threonine protein kinase